MIYYLYGHFSVDGFFFWFDKFSIFLLKKHQNIFILFFCKCVSQHGHHLVGKICSPLCGQFKQTSPAIQMGQWSGGLYIKTKLCPVSSIDVVLMLVI